MVVTELVGTIERRYAIGTSKAEYWAAVSVVVRHESPPTPWLELKASLTIDGFRIEASREAYGPVSLSSFGVRPAWYPIVDISLSEGDGALSCKAVCYWPGDFGELLDKLMGIAEPPSMQSAHPWDCIATPRDREMVRLWREGLTNSEIASELKKQGYTGIVSKTVTNRITELRGSFGKDVVPYDKQRRLSRKVG